MNRPFKVKSQEQGRGSVSTASFGTLEGVHAYIKARWQGVDYIDGPWGFHTDYCTYEFVGFSLRDIGHVGFDETNKCRTFAFKKVGPMNADNFDGLLPELFEKNKFDDGHGDDGYRFETYGQEEAHVRQIAAAEPDRVCTMLDCDGKLYIARGFHFVNRFGYFVAKAALPDFKDFRY